MKWIRNSAVPLDLATNAPAVSFHTIYCVALSKTSADWFLCGRVVFAANLYFLLAQRFRVEKARLKRREKLLHPQR